MATVTFKLYLVTPLLMSSLGIFTYLDRAHKNSSHNDTLHSGNKTYYPAYRTVDIEDMVAAA